MWQASGTSMNTFLLVCCAASSAAALQLNAAAPVLRRSSGNILRVVPVQLEETSGGTTELSNEQITAAAEKASEPSWPEMGSSKQPDPIPLEGLPSSSGGFDPRIIIYVSLPALVLVGQLFFTFSRDALGDVALGPAVMDLWVPP